MKRQNLKGYQFLFSLDPIPINVKLHFSQSYSPLNFKAKNKVFKFRFNIAHSKNRKQNKHIIKSNLQDKSKTKLDVSFLLFLLFSENLLIFISICVQSSNTDLFAWVLVVNWQSLSKVCSSIICKGIKISENNWVEVHFP